MYERVFQPLIAEYQHEYFTALAENRDLRAAWVRAIYTFAFLKAAGLQKLLGIFKVTRRLLG